jgi:tetratricopeptide (TPR) repeat protein
MRRSALLLVTVIAVTFIAMTDARNQDYRSDERIWQDTVTKRPDNPRARNNYAVDLLLRGENAAAERQLRVALALDPAMGQAHANLGVALCRQDRCDEGVPHLERAIAIDPTFAQAHRDLGEAYAGRGQASRAVAEYLLALEAQPDDVFLINRAAWILATAPDAVVRDGLQALGLAERAVVLTGRRHEVSLDSLAAAQAETGQFDLAQQTGAEAIAAARAHNQLAMLPELEDRLARYRSHQPFRQVVGR